MLRLDNVSKHFGGVRALDGVSLSLREGRITGIIGPNGAGKTTLLRVMAGFYKPTRGRVYYRDRDVTSLGPHERARLGIALTFQIPRAPPEFTVGQLVQAAVGKAMYRGTALLAERDREEVWDRVHRVLERVGLSDYAEREASQLPLGLQKRLELARALALEPRVLLLDEPSAGMSPEEARELAGLVRDLNEREGLTIAIVEHNVPLATGLSHYMYVLHYGRLLSEGEPGEVLRDPRVIEAYLGAGYARG